MEASERAAWRDAEGSSLTHLPFIVAALCEALAEVPTVDGSRRTADDVTGAIAGYWEEHAVLPTDAHSRGGAFFVLDDSGGVAADAWPVTQTVADPEGFHEWVLEGAVDLPASREEGRAVVALAAIRRL